MKHCKEGRAEGMACKKQDFLQLESRQGKKAKESVWKVQTPWFGQVVGKVRSNAIRENSSVGLVCKRKFYLPKYRSKNKWH